MSRGITAISDISFHSDKCLHQLFEQQAIRNPDFPALFYNGHSMTYMELNALSNQLAHHLQSLGIQKEDFVAICMDRSFEMFVSIFGILKAGGAYVPIDSDYPPDRLAFMLQDANAKVVLTQEKLADSLPDVDAAVLCLDSDWWEIGRKYQPEKAPNSDVSAQNLAYMIYTSGSTGKPKGVMISHENVVNQIEGQHAIAPKPITKMMLTCSISFDVSVLTIFWTLLQGAPLVIPNQGDEKDMQKLSQLIEKEQVTHILTLPSLHTLLLDQSDPRKLQSLRLVNVSGEVCPLSLAKKHERIIPSAQLYNLYGPTEATVNCTYFTIPKGYNQPKIPIGRPILNYEMFILNDEGKEVGPGEVGEIFIGGAKDVLGRGYWNRPKLTEEKFVQNPFRAFRGGAKLYKTGDLGKWMPTGDIEFLGRSDFQVKFRGFRIELGEIEVAIGNHLGVREVVVVLKEGTELNEQRLLAYVVPSSKFDLSVSELREYLDTCLPEYMIPTTFVFLGKMPLTTNGKIDRKALPEPSLKRPNLAQAYVAPTTNLEKYLAKIWEDLLKIEPIGKRDKFFELGGTSILAARFIGEVQKQMHSSVFITSIFDNPTIESYSNLLEAKYAEGVAKMLGKSESEVSDLDTYGTQWPKTKESILNDLAVQKLSHKDMSRIINTGNSHKINLGHKEREGENQLEKKKLFSKKLDADMLQSFKNIIPKLPISQEQKIYPKKNKPAVFILAPPRSGTTLLRVMLAGHPQIFAANELQLLGFNNLEERSDAYRGKFTLWSEGLVRAVMELKNCSADQAIDLLRVLEIQGYSTKQMYVKLQEWAGEKILVDKSPSYALDSAVLNKAERDFENAVYIHLVRHPYSMVHSFEQYHMDQVLYLEPHNFSSRNLGELVWLESHRNISEFLEKIPRHRHIRVIYEELISHPSKVMWEVCQKIGLPFHDNVLRPYSDLETKMIDGIYKHSRSMGDINFDKQTKINSSKANDWKGVIEDNFLCPETWSLATFFGYQKIDTKSEIVEEPKIDTPMEAKHSDQNQNVKQPSDNIQENTIISEIEETAKIPTREFEVEEFKKPVNQDNHKSEKIKNVNQIEAEFQNAEKLVDLKDAQIQLDNLASKPNPSNFTNAPQDKTPGKKKSRKNKKNNDIAIIGMACRVAGANNLNEFWKNLVEGTDVSVELDFEENQIENQVNRSYVLADAESFDASFFGFHPKEAKMMDPQHRVFLEVALTALENAGYNPKKYVGRIGVFGGVARNSYFSNNIASHKQLLSNAAEYLDMLGSEKAFSVTRVAYKLNLKGPAVNVQTACSSSGVAVHLACQSILEGDSDIVLVGGGRIQPPLNNGYKYTEGGPLSPDGFCRAFDAKANGMVQGHGMVMIVLKKLEKAIKDRDHIWAVIKGTSINNDGSEKIGFTAPSIKGQSEAILKAHKKAKVKAESISYIEAHGTGTILGDPIEIQGLTKAFRKTTNKKQFCAIGSVKTNIGHLDAGACVAGIIKTALALKNELLPPNLHFESPNPQIDFVNSPFKVVSKLKPWKKGEFPRRAGVSSFGLGGTNAHVVLEEAPREELEVKEQTWPSEILIVSGKTENALNAQTSLYLKTGKNNLANLAFSTAVGKQAWDQRKALIIDNLNQVHSEGSQKHTALTIKGHAQKRNHKVVFLFPGGGAQYLSMGKDLYHNLPVFRKHVDNCAELLKKHHGVKIDRVIKGEVDPSFDLEKPSIALPALFTVEYALAMTWMEWGLIPAEMIGHSMGEYTAACISGVITLKDALALVTVRGKLFEKLPAEGGMLSVPVSEKEVLSHMDNGLCVAVINKPDNCVISGSIKSIDRLQTKLQNLGIETKKIHISVAAHSAQIEPILESFEYFLENIKFKKPRIPYISNVTGTWIKAKEATSSKYWIRHIRHTVRFSDGLETLFQHGDRIFLEVGPGQTLSTFARQHPSKNPKQLILASLRHPKENQNDLTFLQKTIAKLWVEGIEVNWEKFYRGQNRSRFPLPGYPFERKRFWIEAASVSSKQEAESSIDSTEINVSSKEEKVSEIHDELLLEKGANISNPGSSIEKQQPKTGNPITRKAILVSKIKHILYELSGLEPGEMDIQATFLEMGFDSLFLSQAVIHFNKQLDLKISFRQLFEEASSIQALANYADDILPQGKFEPSEDLAQGFENNETIDENTGSGNFEAMIRAQMKMIERQLDQMKSGKVDIKSEAASKIPNLLSIPLTNAKNETEKPTTIKRSIKGVTEKMGNYKNISTSDDLTQKQRKGLEEFMEKYIAMTSKSKLQAQKHRKYYADPRSVTGFSKLWKEIVYQIAAEKSKGSKIWDIDGNEYVDFVMSYGVALFGHAPDFVQKATIEQMFKGNSLDVLPPQSSEVAEMICELSDMDRATLANTGTEAVLGAVRAARTYSAKDKIAVFDTDYHGLIGQFMLRGVHLKDRTNVLPAAAGIPNFVVENTLVLDYDDPEVLLKLEKEIKDLAAVVIEPIQAQNPHWQHFELIKQIRILTKQHDVALIFDEIINGFRLHQQGAQAWYGVEADLVAYGKSISGGLPLSAVAGKAKYMEAFDGGWWQYGDDSAPEGTMTYFASTFIKNAISVCSAHAALTKLKEDGPALQLDLNQKAYDFCNRVREVFLKTKAPLFIQNTSSFYMIKPADKNPLTRLFHYFLRFRGINMRERPCFISTAHTSADLEKAVEAIEMAILDMFNADLLIPYHGEDFNVIVPPPKHLLKGTDWKIEPESIPLTEGQKEVFVSSLFSDESNLAYNIGTEIRLEGEIDLNAIKGALIDLAERHEALRLSFSKDGAYQIIESEIKLDIPVLDWSTLSNDEKDANLSALHLEEANAPFDLFRAPLFKCKIVKLENKVHLLLLTVHHIIADGWSLGILTHDLGKFYAKRTKSPIEFLDYKPFGTFVKEQLAFKRSADFEKTNQFWLSKFDGNIQALNFPSDKKRPELQTYKSECQRIRFSLEEYRKIQKIAGKNASTFYFFLFGAFQTFLSKISGQNDLTIGIVAAGQNLPGNEQLVGHSANLLPIRMKVDADNKFKEHLKKVRGVLLDAFEHQNFTFSELVRQLKIVRDPSRNPIVTVVFNMDSPLENLNYGDLKVSTRPIQKLYETFDFFINVKPLEDCLLFEWFYNVDLFERADIKFRLNQFKAYLDEILIDSEINIGKIKLIESENVVEKSDSVQSATNIESSSSKDDSNLPSAQKTTQTIDLPAQEKEKLDYLLHKNFENQVDITPNAVALEFENQKFTYQSLNQRSNQIAHHLISKGIQAGSYVGIFLKRGPDLIAGILGILKTGAAYLPLDILNPTERLKVIIEDVNADFIVTDTENLDLLPKGNHQFVLVDKLVATKESISNPEIKISQKDHAYIIYTSGSTGIPKGVAISHEQISHHILTVGDYLNFSDKEVVFSVTSASFDPSVQDFFMPLSCGAKLILASQEITKDGFLLKNKLNASDASWMVATPAAWRMLLLSGWKGKRSLNIISTGEALSKKLGIQLHKCGKTLWNFYGPTETVIYATAKQISEADLIEGDPDHWASIGKPLPKTSTYILDGKLEPLPPGTPGELYIGGFRVAKGYYNRPQKTSEVFLENPFGNDELFYKTGDLVVLEPDGNIRYISRMDNQVKLRGHRIELGEIEAKIRRHKGINEAVVVLREDQPDDKKLVAYVKMEEGNQLNVLDLNRHLSAVLPAYMLPSTIIELIDFPLTSAGKINRRKLPAPAFSRKKISASFQKADSTTEVRLSKIWKVLLNVPEVGANDDFYELGGHSLMAVSMMAKIEEEFGVQLPLVTFIEHSTIGAIAKRIDTELENEKEEDAPYPAFENETSVQAAKTIPLTAGQEEIWVSHHLHEQAAKSFNIGSEIILEGDLDVEALRQSIKELVNRHEALRTTINEGGKTQIIHPAKEIEVPYYVWSHLKESEQVNRVAALKKLEIEQVFDLKKAPLAHFIILKLSEEKHLLLLTMHHILLDGWSLGVLIEDLGKLYQNIIGYKKISLNKPAQLSQYVAHLQQWNQSSGFKKSEDFWLNQYENEIPFLGFPAKQIQSQQPSFKADQQSIHFSNDFIEKLKVQAKQNKTTFYTYMLAAFQAYLSKLAQQETFVLGVSVSGKSIVQFSDLIAHRTNLLPLKVIVDQDSSFQTHLTLANIQLLEAFDHQDYTLGTLVKKLKVSRDGNRHPLVTVVFNMETMNREYDFGDLMVETEFIPGNYKTLDLIVHMKPSKRGYEFKWIYKTDLFTREDVTRKLSGFEIFLKNIVRQPNQSISTISILPNEERKRILKFGRSELVVDFDLCCLHQLLESQVLKTPHKKAIIFGNSSLTYLELNKKANSLARYLIDKGLRVDNEGKTNNYVGICLERSADILVAIYGVLKAGAAYVPLDPLNPKQRLNSILVDADCQFLITEKHLVRKTVDFSGIHIVLEEDEKYISKRNTENLNLLLSPLSEAYMIYTSGSTGKPKGVAIQHKSVLNTLHGINCYLKVSVEDIFYSVSSMAFDMSIPDYFLSLANGATLILASSETKKDGFLLKEDLELYRPTMMQATPTTWQMLLLAEWTGHSKLKAVAGGEGFSKELAEKLLEKCFRVWNGYGPTETTIYATFKEVTWSNINGLSNQNFVPIGKPNPNVEILILNDQKDLATIGQPGELYISGPGVARGYLNRPELTAMVFLKGERLNIEAGSDLWYKTGDLAKWLPNGDIDFIGRIDNQVKIRGFRIELGEIEASIEQFDFVESCAVIVHKAESAKEMLVAYLVLKPGTDLFEQELKNNLRNIIPGYMIPSIFVKLSQMPLTNSLKIDRNALPIPNLNKLRSETKYSLPKTDTEYRLLEIWKKVLGLRKVSTADDFFDLGGHSLKAVELMSLINKEFGKKLPITTLFQNATIQELSLLFEGNQLEIKSKWSSLVPVKSKGSKPPIYLVHGGGLHVLFYQTLVKYLDSDQPVYALQAKGLDGKSEPLGTIEEMAAHYISEILEENPIGPYSLAGYSLGGLIAFEMTKQLQAMGKEVKVLAMLDAVARYNWEGNGMSGKLKKKFKKAGFNLNLLLKEPAKTAKYKAEVLKMQRLHLKGKVDNPYGDTNLDPTQNEGNLAGKKVYEKSMAAFEKYVLEPLDVKIDLFKAKEQMFFLNDPAYYGWSNFANKGVSVHEIDGNHMTLFEEKNGKEVARILQLCLDGLNM